MIAVNINVFPTPSAIVNNDFNRREVNVMIVRAELVEAQESIHISTRSMRTDSWISRAGSIGSLAIAHSVSAPHPNALYF